MSLKQWIGGKSTLTAVVTALVVSLAAGTAFADEQDEQPDEQSVDDMSAEEIAERVQHFYSETEDFQASFVQEYNDIAAGDTTQSRGRVYFKKPGMMRWDYYQPDEDERDRMLVSDGDHLWVYEYEYQQVFQQCLEDNDLPIALQFLMGEGELLEEFEVELTDDSTAEQPELELTPNEPTGEYSRLEFALDPDSFEVTKSTLYDPYGNSNEIDFRNAQVNQNLSADGFQFETPEGARELNPEQDCD